MSMLLGAFLEKPASTKFYGEDEGEFILLILRRSLITNIPWLVISGLMFFAPMFLGSLAVFTDDPIFVSFPMDVTFVILLAWYFFWFFYTFMNYMNWFYNVNIITNRRIVDMDFTGFSHRNITEAPLKSVEDVTHTITGVVEVSFNFGNVLIQTAAEKRELEFQEIPQPARAADIISDLVAKSKQNTGGDNA